MSKNSKTKRTPQVSARQFVATGVGGAAMIGVGLLLASPPGTPPPAASTAAVQLASFDSLLAPPPLSPASANDWWLTEDSSLVGPGASAPTPTALAAAISGISFPSLPILGIFIGDGADAPANCTGAACNGGNAGIFFGNGGKGANGGNGGSGGLFFGQGGDGGNGVTGTAGTLGVDGFPAQWDPKLGIHVT